MMNNMNLELISKNMNLNEEQMAELLRACSIEANDGTVTMSETMQLMAYAKEHKFDCERKAQDYLEMSVERCNIFIDTCELLRDQFPMLLERLTPLLLKNGKRLLIPSGVESELKNLFFKNEELRQKISTVLDLLEKKEAEGVVMVCGREGVTFADQQMLTIATCALMGDTALFITRDHALSEDILRLNETASVRGGRLVVNRINKYGYLSRYVPLAERTVSYEGAMLEAS